MTPTAASRRVWTRYVAIGDSFTEGMSDPDPTRPDAYVGWADRLAHHLDAIAEQEHLPFGYANLAVRGRKLDDVVGPQLDAALTMQPDLVSMVGGGNDLLRPQVDLDGLASRLEEAVVRLRHSGADVLLATPTDTRDAGLFKALRGRHAVHAANLFTIAQRHGCHVLNLWGMAALRDWRMWSEDRIHLTARGPPPGGAGRAHRARPPHRPGRLDHPAAPGRPRRPAGRSCAATPSGPAPTPARGCSAGCRAAPPATPSTPSGPGSSTSATPMASRATRPCPTPEPPDRPSRDRSDVRAPRYPRPMPATRLMPTEEGQDLIDLTREICDKELRPDGRCRRARRRDRRVLPHRGLPHPGGGAGCSRCPTPRSSAATASPTRSTSRSSRRSPRRG